jgi:hypothetical protein
MIETYKLLGIILIATGIVDMVVLPRILARVREEKGTPLVTSVIWVVALGTMIVGLLCFLGVFGTF